MEERGEVTEADVAAEMRFFARLVANVDFSIERMQARFERALYAVWAGKPYPDEERHPLEFTPSEWDAVTEEVEAWTTAADRAFG